MEGPRPLSDPTEPRQLSSIPLSPFLFDSLCFLMGL